jgi:mRNA-degrading endonuclease toxin of MazEF toxin-antitoxin module
MGVAVTTQLSPPVSLLFGKKRRCIIVTMVVTVAVTSPTVAALG